MTSTLSLLIPIDAVVHEIEGGGYWAEVPRFPGCVAQAETLVALKQSLIQAIEDWSSPSAFKTEAEARRLAIIQGSSVLANESYPQPYEYQPPATWTDEDD